MILDGCRTQDWPEALREASHRKFPKVAALVLTRLCFFLGLGGERLCFGISTNDYLNYTATDFNGTKLHGHKINF